MYYDDRQAAGRRRIVKIAGLFVAAQSLVALSVLAGNGLGPALPLSARGQVEVAHRELSGLAMRPDGLLVAVTDAAPVAVLLDPSGDPAVPPREVDFGEPLIRELSACAPGATSPACRKFERLLSSQWEAVSVDGRGNHWMLNEALNIVVGLDADLERVRSAIEFDFAGLPGSAASTDTDKTLGEGLVVLANGHILVAKEQNPAVIVELGLAGEAAAGYAPELLLEPGEAFVAPRRAHFEVLHSWQVELPMGDCDLSELTTDADGRLYLLSQRCRVVARLPQLSARAAKVVPDLVRAVPHSVRHPEGLAFTSRGLVVADDHDLAGADVIVLDAFDARG